MNENIKKEIDCGHCSLGIELGSTRIKSILINSERDVIASGSFDWSSELENGVWTYSEEAIMYGLMSSFQSLQNNVKEEYSTVIRRIKSAGISAMMHGYIALDSTGQFLTPFRTWRNTITKDESEELTALLGYPIPQRWTISHLTKDIKEDCGYLKNLSHVFTLASFVHWKLTGENVIGIGDASGLFPIDFNALDYDEKSIKTFEEKFVSGKYEWSIRSIFPHVICAGEKAGVLSDEGAHILDPYGNLLPGAILCAPEGDAQTGMVATNSIDELSGNVSAGTSAFAMVVLQKPLLKVYSAIDIVTTPEGKPVAMAHSNNCTGSYDAWLNVIKQSVTALGFSINKGEFYDIILKEALKGDPDCDGLLSYGYISGEHITAVEEGRPLFLYKPGDSFNLQNFIKSELYSALCSMRAGMDILKNQEHVALSRLTGHGGFFKTPEVGCYIMSAAMGVPVRVLSSAGEGGAWGIALLADYLSYSHMPLSEYLETKVFSSDSGKVYIADEKDMDGFQKYYERYMNALDLEREASRVLK